MRKYIIWFFSITPFLFACNGTNAPDGIIERDRMVNLLTEVHITDGTMYNLRQDKDSLYKYGLSRYLYIFKKFHTDSIHFKKSLKFYSSDPPVMLDMYNQILEKLKVKTDSLNKVRYKSVAK